MFKRTTLALCIALALNASTQAAGILVFDATSKMQMVIDSAQRAKEFAQSISEARNHLNQLKSQAEHYKSMVEGHYGFEEILSDPNLNDVIDLSAYSDLYDAIDDISDLRSEFDLYSDDPVIQRRYDMQLKQLRFQEMLYERSTERNERMSRLLNQFGSATTPAAKEDLANSINFETMQMQNEQRMMDSMSNMLERQKTLEAQQRSLKLKQQIFGDGIPLKRG
ncbi:type IV secretion system protein [Vibrio owensii]|uniref:type IV secretion system protein n=1 Tax=Vibrio owensii TaxID=696485 RepID=UPI00221FC8DB|nr:type IV secretion system protein [Vibrio owensii]